MADRPRPGLGRAAPTLPQRLPSARSRCVRRVGARQPHLSRVAFAARPACCWTVRPHAAHRRWPVRRDRATPGRGRGRWDRSSFMPVTLPIRRHAAGGAGADRRRAGWLRGRRRHGRWMAAAGRRRCRPSVGSPLSRVVASRRMIKDASEVFALRRAGCGAGGNRAEPQDAGPRRTHGTRGRAGDR